MTSYNLNATQVRILQALSSNDGAAGMTRSQLEEVVGAACGTGNLGPVAGERLEDHPDSLAALGLVSPREEESDNGTSRTVWHATFRGRKAAEKYQLREHIEVGKKLPSRRLDPIVRRMKSVRTYGLELFSHEDCEEIRNELGVSEANYSDDSIRLQICNRRKVGAFRDPSDKARKAIEACLRGFGVDGNVIKGLLTEEQVAKLERKLKTLAAAAV